ncbi:MAG: hypothetical protein KKD33_07005, partial [Verrucomicrobia bacterium]|nr:hypothetical protein [Verrucomicrobiota bacterium]
MQYSLNGSHWQIKAFFPHAFDYALRGWKNLGFLDRNGETPWISATVPGCVQHDLVKAGMINDPYKGLHDLSCEWVMLRDWIYRRKFRIPSALISYSEIVLRFEGLDYSGKVFLNDRCLGNFEGTFLPVEFDITDVVNRKADNHLVVQFDRVPQNENGNGRSTKVNVFKPRFSYGWDFSTSLVPSGIWDDVFLRGTRGVRLLDVHVQPEVAGEKGVVDVEIAAISDRPRSVIFSLTIQDRGREIKKTRVHHRLQAGKNYFHFGLQMMNPRLWWPNGYGAQNHYRLHVAVEDKTGISDERDTTFGFRKVCFIRNESAKKDALAYTCVINGKKVFLKGWNWVPADLMYGSVTLEKYRWLIRMMKESGANLVRVWGGGLIEKQLFYRLCDEHGIMIWQEFPQSGSALDAIPPVTRDYLEKLKQVAVTAIRRRRNHPALILWCGGNELAYYKGRKRLPLSGRHPVIRMLANLVKRYDAKRHFLPTSPSGSMFFISKRNLNRGVHHDVHGPWHFWVPMHYDYYNQCDAQFHSEFGASGYSSVATLKAIADGAGLWPVDERNPINRHHGNMWVQSDLIKNTFEVFGDIKDINHFVFASQYLQAEGLRYAIEAHRRRKFLCSGVIPWQLNEPWPNASCSNTVEYNGKPKMAFYYVKKAYEPCHLSLRYDRLAWKANEPFRADIFGHNSLDRSRPVLAEYQIRDICGNVLQERTIEMTLKPAATFPVQAIHWPVAVLKYNLFLVALRLSDSGKQPLSSENLYLFSTVENAPLAALFALPKARLTLIPKGCKGDDFHVRICNHSAVPAYFVKVAPKDETQASYCSSNYMVLAAKSECDCLITVNLAMRNRKAMPAFGCNA